MRLTETMILNKHKMYQIPQDEYGFLMATNKLGQIEDIEEELGIDLNILFKALSCGAWEKRKDNVLNFDDCKLLYKRIQIGSNVHWLSNYGKTWALTKEELQ